MLMWRVSFLLTNHYMECEFLIFDGSGINILGMVWISRASLRMTTSSDDVTTIASRRLESNIMFNVPLVVSILLLLHMVSFRLYYALTV